MILRESEAAQRFERLSRSTAEGLVFHPRGTPGAGYVVDAAAARRIKVYFASYRLMFAALFASTLAFLPDWLESHPFFAGMIAGFACFSADRLIMRGLLWRQPRASTRWREEDGPPTQPERSSTVETSCALFNAGMILLLLLFVAVVSRSIDAWLYAAACAALLIFAGLQVWRARRT